MAFFEYFKIESIDSTEKLSELIDLHIEELSDFRRQSLDEMLVSANLIESLIFFRHNFISQIDYNQLNNRYFILALLDICERLNLRGPIPILSRIINENNIPINSRIEAGISFVYPKPSKAEDMISKFSFICSKLQYAIENEEDNKEASLITFLYYYSAVIDSLHPSKAQKVRDEFILNIKNNSYPFLQELKSISELDVVADNIIEIIQNYIDKLNRNLYSYTNTTKDEELLIEHDTDYANLIASLDSISFDKIRQIAIKKSSNDLLENRGVGIIERERDLYTYLKSYGNMHRAKLLSALENPFPQSFTEPISIIDWGCGQGLASFVMMEKYKNSLISQLILIEPSELALRRASLHCKTLNPQVEIITIQKKLDALVLSDFDCLHGSNVINLFANILDIDDYSVNKLTKLLTLIRKETNYYVCVSPHIDELKTAKIARFHNYFKNSTDYVCIHQESNTKEGKYWLCNNVYKYKKLNHGFYNCGNFIGANGCEKRWTREVRVFKA